MKPQINMIGVICQDLEASRDFYRDVLGFEVSFEMEGRYVEFVSPGVRFALTTPDVMHAETKHESYAGKPSGQRLELAFAVDTPADVDTTYDDLIGKGAEPIKGPADMPWGQRTAFFADPDGNIHEVFADIPS